MQKAHAPAQALVPPSVAPRPARRAGLMAIPGVGPVVAAGWLVATLTGAAAVGTAGGIVGALSQAGFSPEDADVYAESIRRGGALVSVKVEEADARACRR